MFRVRRRSKRRRHNKSSMRLFMPSPEYPGVLGEYLSKNFRLTGTMRCLGVLAILRLLEDIRKTRWGRKYCTKLAGGLLRRILFKRREGWFDIVGFLSKFRAPKDLHEMFKELSTLLFGSSGAESFQRKADISQRKRDKVEFGSEKEEADYVVKLIKQIFGE